MGEILLAASDVERFYSGHRRIPFEHQKLNTRHVKSRKAHEHDEECMDDLAGLALPVLAPSEPSAPTRGTLHQFNHLVSCF